jgi:hypothetical protein
MLQPTSLSDGDVLSKIRFIDNKCTCLFGQANIAISLPIGFHLLVCFLRKCLQAAVVPPVVVVVVVVVVGELLVTYFNVRADKTESDLTNKTVPKTVLWCLAQIKRTYYI